MPSISLCICTMNRPGELNRCLESVFQSPEIPDEVIVSDDSPNGQPTQAIVSQYPEVVYQTGPRQGLGPNRNACIRSAKGSYIIFIDDDVRVSPDFFAIARRLITTADDQIIFTGYEINYGDDQIRKVVPHNADFWGLQRVPATGEYHAIVINATVFPSSLFNKAFFDELLRYGSDEIDIARHATSLGYRIEFIDDLYVEHYPSSINRDTYRRFTHASRLYTTTKAYWQYERSFFKAFAYLILAPLQLVGSAVKQGRVQSVWDALQAIKLASAYLLTYSRITR